MTVPSPTDADAATVRLRLVSDMLLQKAQEVQSKGNASAAQSLSESALDVQRAAALLQELARLVHLPPPRLRSDSDASLSSISSNDGSTISSLSVGGRPPPAASTSIKDLVAKLNRVDTMLGKKSDEMRLKGNENAAHALHQSALAVRIAAQHIAEQQLMTRTLVVTARALREQLREHCRFVLVDDEITDETTLDDELTRRVLDNLQTLVAMREVVRAVAPSATSPDRLRDLLMRGVTVQESNVTKDEVERLSALCGSLQRQLEESQTRHQRELREANDATENMRIQCEALEKALVDLEAEYHERRERELEHLNALHERQKGTHEELKKLLLAKEEEVTALKIQSDAWMNQLTQQQETLEELQQQREQDHQFYDREVNELREQVHMRDADLRVARDELRVLHEQLEERTSSGQEEEVHFVLAQAENERVIEQLRHQVDTLQKQHDALRVEREDLVIAREEAQLHLDTARSELNVRVEEAERSAKAAAACVEEREARIAELEGTHGNGKDHGNGGPKDMELQKELQIQVFCLEQHLEEERSRRCGLEEELERGRKALVALEVELEGRVKELALLREEDAKRFADAHTTIASEIKERVSKLETALEHEHARVESLESELREQTESFTQVSAQLVATQQDLSGIRSESTRVRDDAIVWKQNVLVLAREICTDTECLTECSTYDEVIKALCQRCTHLLGEAGELKVQCEELKSSHEVELIEARDAAKSELYKLQADNETLRATLTQLEEDKASLKAQYQALEATQLESSQANGVKASESEELRRKLIEVEAEFDRYRSRSHTALKKIEKRAELLNTMRKENEGLAQGIAEMKLAFDAATEKEKLVTARLDEVTRTLLMREEEYAQRIEEARAKLNDAENKCVMLDAANTELEQKFNEMDAKVSTLMEEKEVLAQAKHALHEQALELKVVELDECKKQVEDANTALAQSEDNVKSRDDTIQQLEEQIAKFESEILGLQDSAERAVLREQELQQMQEDLTTRVEELTKLLGQQRLELEAVVTSRNTNNADEEKCTQTNLESEKLSVQLQAAARETEELTARLVETQLAKVAVDQEAEQLRTQLAQLKNELANVSSQNDSDELATLKQSQHAQETKIKRLLEEIEIVSKHQIEDQRIISELKEELRKSEENLEGARGQLRRAQDTAQSVASVDKTREIEMDDAKNQTMKDLRARIVELEVLLAESARAQTSTSNSDTALGKESDDLAALQASRQAKREQYEQEQETANRMKLVIEYVKKTTGVINELQKTMDEYSSVFRDACTLRDEENSAEDEEARNGHAEVTVATGTSEYEESLIFKSGVVVKAGASFSLPVFCDKPGGRVEWKFAVKEDGADVGFALSVETTSSNGKRSRETIVPSARVNELSGVYDVKSSSATTLRFEWDNSFSWLNEKTLDYHVSVLEPLSETKKALLVQERTLKAKITTMDERLSLLRMEKERRQHLASALLHFQQCAEEKDARLARFSKRREAIQQTKVALQVRMEDLNNQLRVLVNEQDDLATAERDVLKAWEALSSEHEDVDMTMRLSANSRLDEVREALEARMQSLQDELQTVTSAITTA